MEGRDGGSLPGIHTVPGTQWASVTTSGVEEAEARVPRETRFTSACSADSSPVLSSWRDAPRGPIQLGSPLPPLDQEASAEQLAAALPASGTSGCPGTYPQPEGGSVSGSKGNKR